MVEDGEKEYFRLQVVSQVTTSALMTPNRAATVTSSL